MGKLIKPFSGNEGLRLYQLTSMFSYEICKFPCSLDCMNRKHIHVHAYLYVLVSILTLRKIHPNPRGHRLVVKWHYTQLVTSIH